jgi:uncharacterized protein YrzB (UPF0473 family)
MKNELRLEGVQRIALLKAAFGETVELEDEAGGTHVYQVLSEFSVGGSAYAILQDERQRRDDEIDVFRIGQGDDGSLELETIDDDDEWDAVAELYDEMTVSFED